MIKSKEDLNYYLAQDKLALYVPDGRKYPRPFCDDIWKFQIALRKTEYAVNCCNHGIGKLYVLFRKIRYHRISVKYGFTIPTNVFGPGLSIAHYGTIVVSTAARIGRNCRIHEGVNIGCTNGERQAAVIGDNVFIGTGAKIIGNVTIADNIVIGAGAVVTKSFSERGITLGGVPARKISDNGSKPFIAAAVYSEKTD